LLELMTESREPGYALPGSLLRRRRREIALY
jgi:hypothetical protein